MDEYKIISINDYTIEDSQGYAEKIKLVYFQDSNMLIDSLSIKDIDFIESNLQNLIQDYVDSRNQS